MNASCPISLCDTDPGYCASRLSSDDVAALTFIVLIPVLIAVVAPLCTSPGRCQRDDDTERMHAARHAIDPPMYLCGVGLLPLDCGDSGLLVVIWVLLIAFLCIFFGLLQHERPCTTGLGRCRTISCFCGNVIAQGYAFMFGSLLLSCFLLVQRITRMPSKHRPHHKWIKASLVCGALLLSLTGVFPEVYDSNSTISSWGLYYLHLLGVFGGGALLMGVPYFWFMKHWWTHRSEVPLRSVAARSTYFLAALSFGIAMQVASSVVEDQVAAARVPLIGDSFSTVDYCGYMRDRTECEAWPAMPPEQCDALLECVAGRRTDGCTISAPHASNSSFVQPNFRCAYLPADIDASTALIAPRPYLEHLASADLMACVKSECPLYYYSRGVALEFATLFILLTYVGSYALHDCHRLLARQKGARLIADAEGASAECASAEYIAPSASVAREAGAS